MKVTPLDLRQQRFQTVMRGYDRGEVNAFLAEASEDYENAVRENERLRQELSKSEAVLNEHRSQEKNLRNTLLTAQKLADEIKENAQQEAGRILRDAEGRADLVLQKSQSRVEEVQREIDGLRLKRKDVETSLESIISALYNTIEFVREQDNKHRDEKILLHRPRSGDAGASATYSKTAAFANGTDRTADKPADPAVASAVAALGPDEAMASLEDVLGRTAAQ
jgi:cell division initiation protein